MSSEQLQEHLNQMRAGRAPIPLTRDAGVERAMQLRKKGWTYGTIANVMGEYHGLYYCQEWWHELCRRKGAPPKFPGRGFKPKAERETPA